MNGESMIWLLMLGMVFGMSLPACPGIDVKGVLEEHFPGSQIEIKEVEYKKCVDMETYLEVEAYIDGKKMEFYMSRQGMGPVQVQVKEEYRYNNTYYDDYYREHYYDDDYYEYKKPYYDDDYIRYPQPPVPLNGTVAYHVVLEDGPGSFWFVKDDVVLRIANGFSASCAQDADGVLVARVGYPIKKIELSDPGCYYFNFQNDTVVYKNCTTPEPSRYQMNLTVQVEQQIRSKFGENVKIVEVIPEENGKVKVRYRTYIQLPFLGVVLPLEAEYEEEIELES